MTRYRIQQWVPALRKWVSHDRFKEKHNRALLREFHDWLSVRYSLEFYAEDSVDDANTFLKERADG